MAGAADSSIKSRQIQKSKKKPAKRKKAGRRTEGKTDGAQQVGPTEGRRSSEMASGVGMPDDQSTYRATDSLTD